MCAAVCVLCSIVAEQRRMLLNTIHGDNDHNAHSGIPLLLLLLLGWNGDMGDNTGERENRMENASHPFLFSLHRWHISKMLFYNGWVVRPNITYSSHGV